MRTNRPKSIVLKGGQQPRVYRTYEDWLATQKQDKRTPTERGVRVGSAVLWRHKQNTIILSDRVTVLAIDGNTLTVIVKDVKERTCQIDISEVVANEDDRLSVRETPASAENAAKPETKDSEVPEEPEEPEDQRKLD